MTSKHNFSANQHNFIIDAAYNLPIDEMRALLLTVSKIDSKKHAPETPYLLDSIEFADMFNIPKSTASKRLKAAIETLQTSLIEIYRKIESDTYKSRKVWLDDVTYKVNQSNELFKVSVTFTNYVNEFLFELQDNFTQIKINDVAKLNTPFSIRLFSWLAKAENVGDNQASKTKKLILTKDEILLMAGLVGKYKEFNVFKRDLIDRAITLINENTNYNVTTQTIRTGRVATGIRFTYSVNNKKISLKLPKRPQVVSGTHAEGEYARECINTILDYELETDALTKAHAKKLIKFFAIVGDKYAIEHYSKKYAL